MSNKVIYPTPVQDKTINKYFLVYLVLMALFSFVLREIYINRYDFKDRLRLNIEGEFPFTYLYVGDAWNYHEIALNLAQGKEYGFPYYPPVFPYVLSIMYKISAPAGYLQSTQANQDVYGFKCYKPSKRILNGINAAALIIAGIIFFHLYGYRVSAIAVMLCSFSFGLFMMSGSLNSEAIYIPLYLLTMGAYLFLYRNQSSTATIIAAVLGGILVLTRAESLLIVIFCFLYTVVGWESYVLTRGKFIIVFLVFFLLLPVSWGIKNYRELGIFTFISKNGQVNFYIGNNPVSTGGYSEKIFASGYGIRKLDPSNPRHYEAMTEGYKKGLEFWKSQPHRVLTISKLKFMKFVNSLENGFLVSNIPVGLNGFRDLGDSFYPNKPILKYVFGGLTILGMVMGIFMKKDGWLIPYLFLLGALLANLLYFGLTRSGTSMLPIFYMFSAIPVSMLLFFVSSKPGWITAIFLGLSTVGFIYGITGYNEKIVLETMDEVFHMPREILKKNLPGKAIPEYTQSFEKVRTHPYMVKDNHGLAVAHFNMGSLLVKTGKPLDAKKHYLLALKYDPTHRKAVLNLAYLFKDYLGDPGQALKYFKMFLKLAPRENEAKLVEIEIMKLKVNMKKSS